MWQLRILNHGLGFQIFGPALETLSVKIRRVLDYRDENGSRYCNHRDRDETDMAPSPRTPVTFPKLKEILHAGLKGARPLLTLEVHSVNY